MPTNVFGRAKTLGQVSSSLEAALAKSGYAEISYYTVPGGIAVVTRLEHIHADGSPFDSTERWLVDDEYRQALSLSAYVKELFAVDEGFYRVVVFIFSDEPFASSKHSTTSDEATEWLADGYNTLPASLNGQPVTSSDRCTALIYEFQKNHGDTPHLLLPSHLGARQHLLASGLLAALSTGSMAGSQ